MTDPDPMQRARQIIRAWAAYQPEIARVYLFGSRIRGCGKGGSPVRPDSDLDVAVELNIDDEDEAFDVWFFREEKWHGQLQPCLPWPLDLQWYHPAGAPHVRQYVAECNEVVYMSRPLQEASPHS